MTGILIAVAVVAGVGIVIGILLGVAGEKFKVEVDEKEIAVRELLPGNNCGGCGYPGCDGLAAAIAKGEMPPSACPVGGEAVAAKISEVMGVENAENTRYVAFVKCAGDCEKAKSWNYARHKAMVKYAKAKNIEFVDMNTLKGDYAIDWSTDTRDGGRHLNCKLIEQYL